MLIFFDICQTCFVTRAYAPLLRGAETCRALRASERMCEENCEYSLDNSSTTHTSNRVCTSMYCKQRKCDELLRAALHTRCTSSRCKDEHDAHDAQNVQDARPAHSTRTHFSLAYPIARAICAQASQSLCDSRDQRCVRTSHARCIRF